MKNVEDFLTNPEFIRWVNHTDKELGDYWENWRIANPEQLKAMKIAKEILQGSSFERVMPPLGMKEEVLESILRMKNLAADKPNIEPQMNLTWAELFWNGIGQMSRVAAILIVSFGIALLFNLSKINKIEKVPIVSEVTIRKTTAVGEKMQLTLSDGTKVWLNSSTQVEFPEEFGKDQRIITLTGEAYFEVENDSLRPFTVRTEGLLTTVLGTSFNINTNQSGRTQVALVSGKVVVTSSLKTFTLSPKELIDFDPINAVFNVVNFEIPEILAWKEGVLRFNNASLREVVTALEEWYGVEISLENEKGVKWQFSGEYKKQTLEDVLISMSYVQKFTYQLNDKSLTIRL